MTWKSRSLTCTSPEPKTRYRVRCIGRHREALTKAIRRTRHMRHSRDSTTTLVDEVKTLPSPDARRLDGRRHKVNTWDDVVLLLYNTCRGICELRSPCVRRLIVPLRRKGGVMDVSRARKDYRTNRRASVDNNIPAYRRNCAFVRY